MHIDNNHRLLQEVPEYIQYKTHKLLNNINVDWMSDKDRQASLFSFATQHLYTTLAEKSLDLKDKTIVISGRVADDGVGDYYHMIHTAEQIKKLYPALKIELLPHFDAKTLPKNLKVLDPAQFNTLFLSTDALPLEAQLKVGSADLLLDISLTSHFKNYKNYLLINEYGNGSTHPLSNIMTMGVSPVQLGIALKDKPRLPSLLNLKDSRLKQLLFNTETPSNKDLDLYLSHHELFTAYLKRGSYHQMAFLYTIAALTSSSSKSTVDICLPDIDRNILDLTALKQQGISKLTTIQWINHEWVKSEIRLANEGKEMRLINPYPLDQEDFQTLLLASNPLIGCTGDNTLSEVLSFDRFPFYEIRGVKTLFWFDMKNVASEIGAPTFLLKKYFEELSAITSSCTPIEINNLNSYYDNLPQLSSSLKDAAETSKSAIEQLYALNTKHTLLFETKELLQEIYQTALYVAQDPVKACLEGRQANMRIFLKAKNILEKYNNLIAAQVNVNDENAIKMFNTLMKCKETCKDFFYDIRAADTDILVRFKDMQPQIAEIGNRIATLLKNPHLHKELAAFTQLIKSQYNYNKVLKDVIARQFALQAYPELESCEKELFEKFKKDEIDAFTANKLLKEKIGVLI